MSSRLLRPWTLALCSAPAGALGLAACSSSPSSPLGSATTSPTTSTRARPHHRHVEPRRGPLARHRAHTGGRPLPRRHRRDGADRHRPLRHPAHGTRERRPHHGHRQRAAPGDNVTVQYVLATYSSHKVIQSSWTSKPFSFALGAGQVIPGLGQGCGRHEGRRSTRADHPAQPRLRPAVPGARASPPTTRSSSSSTCSTSANDRPVEVAAHIEALRPRGS